MIDQTDPKTQAPVYPDYTGSDQITSPSAQTDPAQTGFVPSQIPPVVPLDQSATVVVSKQGGGVPKWFYFLFGVTLIVFFIVTALLVLNYTQKSQNPPREEINPTVIPTEAIISTPELTKEILPTASPAPLVISPVVISVPELSKSDEIIDLEKDLNNTDLTQLEKSVVNLNQRMGVISP